MKKFARIDERRYNEQLAEEAQAAAEWKDMDIVYQIMRKHKELPLKGGDASAITEEMAKLERWKEKNGKAAKATGEESVCPEMLKAERKEASYILQLILPRYMG